MTGTLGGGTVQVNAGATLGVFGAVDGTVSLNGGLLAAASGAIDLGALPAGTGTATNDGPGSLTTLTVGGLDTNSSFSGTILDGSGHDVPSPRLGLARWFSPARTLTAATLRFWAENCSVYGPLTSCPDGGTLIVGNASYFARLCRPLPPRQVAASNRRPGAGHDWPSCRRGRRSWMVIEPLHSPGGGVSFS